MGTFQNLAGQQFHRLMVLYRIENAGQHTMWRCLCDCWKLCDVRAQHLQNGNTKSCGCWDADVLRQRSTTHGGCGTPAYESWAAMIQRCTNPQNSEWHNYGGRGITVANRWLKFENFFADMGERPAGLTLDRKKVNLGYSKQNCRWATTSQQANNRRNNRWIEYSGRRLTLTEWARLCGVWPSTLHKQFARYGEQAALCRHKILLEI